MLHVILKGQCVIIHSNVVAKDNNCTLVAIATLPCQTLMIILCTYNVSTK